MMRVRTFRKQVDGVSFRATVERRDDGTQKILFGIEVDDSEKAPIPVGEWSTIGALCELFKAEILSL